MGDPLGDHRLGASGVVAQSTERPSGFDAHLLVVVVEQRAQKSHLVAADPTGRRRGGLPHACVVVLEQRTDREGLPKAARNRDGATAHRGVLVGQRRDERLQRHR